MKIDSLKKDNSINSILSRISKLESQIYPVGSVYISLVNTNPTTLFGGTWTQLKDKFLLSVGDIYKTVNETGGSASHSHKYYVSQIKSKMVLVEARAVNYDSKEMQKTTTISSNLAYNTNSQLGSGNAWNYNDAQEDRSEGTTESISNMPPYLTVYMWKRVS